MKTFKEVEAEVVGTKSFNEILNEKTAGLQAEYSALQAKCSAVEGKIKGVLRKLLELGEKEMRSCGSAYEIEEGFDWHSNPILHAKCKKLEIPGIEEQLHTTSYTCAQCAINRGIDFSAEH